jgi:hypothetical protein
MEMGGRRAVYDLMDMEPPPPPPRKKIVKAAPLKMDRIGEDDQARYSGLKMGQVLDDSVMEQALAAAQKKVKAGETLGRPKLMEEDYEVPYSDKRNTGPRQTPDWTAERIDEYTTRQGKANDWARRARMGEFVKDPMEVLDLDAIMQVYLVLSLAEVSFAFGRSTPGLFRLLGVTSQDSILPLLQAPGVALVVASIGSCILCGAVLAPPLNRSSTVWAIKGFLAGPLAVLQLRGADVLLTRGETEQREKDASVAARGRR